MCRGWRARLLLAVPPAPPPRHYDLRSYRVTYHRTVRRIFLNALSCTIPRPTRELTLNAVFVYIFRYGDRILYYSSGIYHIYYVTLALLPTLDSQLLEKLSSPVLCIVYRRCIMHHGPWTYPIMYPIGIGWSCVGDHWECENVPLPGCGSLDGGLRRGCAIRADGDAWRGWWVAPGALPPASLYAPR
jgi:hypothetical protein